MSDLIERQEAIDALGKAPKFKIGLLKKYAEGRNDQWFDDVAALVKLPSAQPELNEWCHDCKEYDKEHHCCPRWGQVIRTALEEAKPEHKIGKWIMGKCDQCGAHAPFWPMASTYYESDYCPNCGADMRGENHETN